MSEDISQKKESSYYYPMMKKFAEEGQTKSLIIYNDYNYDRLFMRIIGINHDQKADGSGTAGLTFMAANSLNREYQ